MKLGPIQEVFAKNLKESLFGYEKYLEDLNQEKTLLK
jgi:hypothetical protein